MALNITWRLLLLLWHYTFLQSSDFNLRYLPLAELGVWHCAFLYCLTAVYVASLHSSLVDSIISLSTLHFTFGFTLEQPCVLFLVLCCNVHCTALNLAQYFYGEFSMRSPVLQKNTLLQSTKFDFKSFLARKFTPLVLHNESNSRYMHYACG